MHNGESLSTGLKFPTSDKIRYRYFLMCLLVLFTGVYANDVYAHVRWFIDPVDAATFGFEAYSWTDVEVIVCIIIGAGMIATAIALDGFLPKVPVANSKLRHDTMELMRVLTGMSLLLTAYGGELLAPHLSAYGTFGITLVYVQAFIGLLLISNNLIHHAALLLLVLYFGTMVQFGFVKALEYINVVGIALFLFFNHLPNESFREKLKPYSVDMLRIFTGIALVTLGVTEKLSGSMLGQAFLESYPWNFMPAIGLDWFTDQLFVLAAGAVEVVIGTVLILGVVTRLNILVISVFMFISNVVFMIQNENDNALIELIGHMPVIATALILLLLGYGQRLKLKNPLYEKKRQAMVVE